MNGEEDVIYIHSGTLLNQKKERKKEKKESHLQQHGWTRDYHTE